MVSYTSLIAYYSLDPGKLKRIRDKVLYTIGTAIHPSNADIQRISGIRLSSVCGRVNELREEGLVECGGLKIDPFTKKTVTWWRLTSDGENALGSLVKQ